MRMLALLALALAAAAPLAHAQPAADADRSVDIARTAADTAEERLVDLRRAVWSRLDQAQRAAFAERERAWLNAAVRKSRSSAKGWRPRRSWSSSVAFWSPSGAYQSSHPTCAQVSRAEATFSAGKYIFARSSS